MVLMSAWIATQGRGSTNRSAVDLSFNNAFEDGSRKVTAIKGGQEVDTYDDDVFKFEPTGVVRMAKSLGS